MMFDKTIEATQGRIFDIQSYSIHDGSGIRTIVFLKGCYFRCQWCSNPESQNYEIESMTVNGTPRVIGKDVTAKEVMDEVIRDFAYYRHSGGGLTLSGGEPLLQADFASALFQMAKYNGITTAVESTANIDFEILEEKILPYLDVYLMDIKHMNPNKHKQFTGMSNNLVLENAKKIAETGQQIIVRVPVIPTFNDTPEEIAEIANFAKTLSGVRELHLLPYHPYGVDKYKGLGRHYQLANIVTPSSEHMEKLKQVAERYGLQVQIGG